MLKYDSVNIIMVKKYLSEKTRVKNRKVLVESAFVLRVLLEFYRIDKANKYNLLK